MKITVQDILQKELFAQAVVETGASTLADKNIQWVSVIEMPVENFVRKNELVLTTALGCKDDLDAFQRFVEDVMQAEASALVIATGRHIDDIPPEVKAVAEARQFSLIRIPWEVRFANIVEMVLDELAQRKNTEMIQHVKMQQDFLQFILEEKRLHEILAFIQMQVAADVYLTDQHYRLYDLEQYSKEAQEKWQQAFQEEVTIHLDQFIRDPYMKKFDLVAFLNKELIQIPILQVTGAAQGYLFIELPDKAAYEPFLNKYSQILEHAATTIALWLSKKNAVEATENKLRSDFVEELAKGRFRNAEEASLRASPLGYAVQRSYVCIIAQPEKLQEIYEHRNKALGSYKPWERAMLRYLEEELVYAAQALKQEAMITHIEEAFLIYLHIEHQTDYQHATDFLDLVDRRLKHFFPEVTLRWGISGRVQTFADFHKTYIEAKQAVHIGEKKGNQRTWYEEAVLERILLQLPDIPEIGMLRENILDPLLAYQEERKINLIETFIAYQQYRGNVSKTAKHLSLHRQSLLYRLRKIEALTGLSLHDSNHLFLLELSMKTWEMNK
ncbi:PucR family transcriptional regulator [Oceanobacillus sp. CFH 90083]|uniref:PucR family transcriptional regulator n=1 Tax=Oceanobacillus sp. CFH 90083 TaxID=2592336 RepID=UPI00128E6911|nr:PucR family transcriptional regulator [Oceanobacillus sp. CFH 90083]